MGKIRHPLAVAAASIALVAAGAIVAPSPASAHWSCGRAAPPDIDTSGGHHAIWATAVMRVGSSTRCAISATGISGNYSLDYHCWAMDINLIDTWTYAVTVETKERGWIRDPELQDYGSHVKCPNQTNLSAPANIDWAATERAQTKPVAPRR